MSRDYTSGFQEYTFTTARKFLDYLNPLETDRWNPDIHIFRGQPDVNFNLVPSAHRLEGDITASNFYGDHDINPDQQLTFERTVLLAFLESCDKAGLQVPGDSVSVRRLLSQQTLAATRDWPPTEVYQVLAFAQHHGVPTCLLDWTRSPYVAAYFAASSALSNLKEELEGYLAVWALSSRCREVEVIKTPGGVSPYLAAQSGLFTVSRITGSGTGNDVFMASTLDGSADRLTGPDAPFHLQRLRLPKSEAPQLLSGCALLGVTGSVLFPGYEGIAKGVTDWARVQHKHPGPVQDSLRSLLG
ncbi:FRG domain-containing protein [Halomonas sp. TD01]|uniref:FRG domain-containing protein n=1 Tax=Halomonas sp. TD01 TaxID=999141 RepID=UPI000214F5A2|nr:FRG domain-containing protein [Halomonas sp. TD01]EGP19192.1 hypothetical protein GME_12823 [Halomonas sp. TD01]CAH1042386.1 hypothetical protein HPTD01_864 [Halomonas sp. TD01]